MQNIYTKVSLLISTSTLSIFFGYVTHLFFENLVIMSTEESTEMREEDIVAKSSENNNSLKIGCLKIFGLLQIFGC